MSKFPYDVCATQHNKSEQANLGTQAKMYAPIYKGLPLFYCAVVCGCRVITR